MFFLSLICLFSLGINFQQLTLRHVMDRAKQFTKSGSLNEVSMVLLNNGISIPFAIGLIFLFDEWNYVINAYVLYLCYYFMRRLSCC